MREVDFSACRVAYFSMEIGIDPALPTYSGGLGVLAGDTLRSAADLDVPIIGVTLLYKKGYFTQRIDEQGMQHEAPVVWNPEEHLTRLPNTVTVHIAGQEVRVGAWLSVVEGIQGTRNPIIFLDTDLDENEAAWRHITHELYGHDDRYRLSQEIVLGIGGVRMLESLGCTGIQKYHMNEGHSALLTLELFKRSEAADRLHDVRARCVFTTHTPVPAGHDQFDKKLAEELLGAFITPELHDVVFIEGRLNMTCLGLQFSEFINGVAKKHGEVSRSMFPGYHIESITNGVHARFWASPEMQKLFDEYLPGWQADPFSLRYILSIPKERIWDAHQEAKRRLVAFAKTRGATLREDVFTIGFARRFATYKRGDILFQDPARLRRIAERTRGLQLVFAGKAHPKDLEGKRIIQRVIGQLRALSDVMQVCFLEDYNMGVAQILIPGVDLWLNTPARPHEASGTSGMKAAVNGVPQFSTLDGWWLEGHIEHVTGWSIGNEDVSRESNHEEDVEDLYNKLEYIILPKYYDDRAGWIDVMRHAIAINGSFFNTHRMVQQYVLNAYYL
ncbi:alpha-glucan family phosphorylase [Candidatus Woesearchaeota archaeon]|nr:MAG: alpha-glucan family phosphorylase [Candidatus Woesearchaeota archaeon]